MLHSMTGFARQTAETPLGTLTWELRAVNHRYLDVQFKMPDELRPHEQALRQKVAERVRRGKVECALHFQRGGDAGVRLELDDELVTELARHAGKVAAQLSDAAPVSPLDLMRWPGVVRQPDIDVEPLFREASALLDAAIGGLAAMRQSEGERIAEMIESRCRDIETLAAALRERMPDVREAMRTRQRERLDKLDVSADPERLETEIALVMQKIDVDEEMDRLDSHVAEIRETILREEAVGRRLDFLMQELNREANTLGSKAADADTTKTAVELKVLIEQMREQIQNVE